MRSGNGEGGPTICNPGSELLLGGNARVVNFLIMKYCSMLYIKYRKWLKEQQQSFFIYFFAQ